MKHIFVVNPGAGKSDATEGVRRAADLLDGSLESEIYVTLSPGDATRYVRSRCAASGGERLRFYACGGDGTLNEVVSGAAGFGNVEVACYPVGSGNDYVKYYGGAERFLDMERLTLGEPHPVDLMRVVAEGGDAHGTDRYSINICNFGFDAMVCKTMEEVRRKWLIGGRNAYTTGILKALFRGRRTNCRISVDGALVNDGDILLCTLGNGRYVGGSYQCSPLSLNDDGLIEVCFFKPMSVVSFARLIGSYRDGSFIDRDDVKKLMVYRRGSTVDIECPSPIDLCVDGELLSGSRFRVSQMPRAIEFVVPK